MRARRDMSPLTRSLGDDTRETVVVMHRYAVLVYEL